MSHIVSVFLTGWLPWLILATLAGAVGTVVFVILSFDGNCKRCRARARARGKCTCLIDCGHVDCVGDRPTIRAAWKERELQLLNGEIEWEDL